MINLNKTNTSVVKTRSEKSVYLSLEYIYTHFKRFLTILFFFNLVSVSQGQDDDIFKVKQYTVISIV